MEIIILAKSSDETYGLLSHRNKKNLVINDCKSSSWFLTDEFFETTPKKLVGKFNFALKEPPSSVQNCSGSALNDELMSKSP
jgi:hypothetical protein